MGLIVIWAVMGGVIAVIAKSKRFDPLLWFIYGAILWPIALAHVLVKAPAEAPRSSDAVQLTADADSTKTCPECAETIKLAAVVCRFCGNRTFSEQAEEVPPAVSEEEMDAWFADLQLPRPKLPR